MNFVHLRNVQKSEHESFAESHHLEGDIDMFKVISMLLTEQERRNKIGVKDKGEFLSSNLVNSKCYNFRFYKLCKLLLISRIFF